MKGIIKYTKLNNFRINQIRDIYPLELKIILIKINLWDIWLNNNF